MNKIETMNKTENQDNETSKNHAGLKDFHAGLKDFNKDNLTNLKNNSEVDAKMSLLTDEIETNEDGSTATKIQTETLEQTVKQKITTSTNIDNNKKVAVILMNLGTPDEPTAKGVGRYLREFLSDTRVIEIPMFIWQIILNVFVIPLRSPKVAEAYKSIWEGDSPIRNVINAQVNALNTRWENQFTDCEISVHAAMTYGNPSIPDVFGKLKSQGIERFVILPLFPQYSSTSTGASYDAISKWTKSQRDLPSITIIKDYYDHPLYIKALANSVHRFQKEHGKPDKLMMSFHGIPKPFEDKGDSYPTRCRRTAKLLAEELGIHDDEWICSFQSRFGLQEWVKPYTDYVLEDWGKQGIKSVQIMSPAFSADCLETLEELAIENRDNFINAGGKEYAYIPALNAHEDHIDLLEALVLPLAEGWVRTHRV